MLAQLLYILTSAITITKACECRSANFGTDVRTGDLKSPGYPTGYCANLDCKYEIDGAAGQTVHLSIISFETEQRHDYLAIHETFVIASQQHSAKIATLSGKDVGWPLYASSEGSGFMLRFVSDSSEQFGGFHARFSRMNASLPGVSCPRLYHEAIATEQTLPSPSSAFSYTAGCAYMINTTESNAIKLRIITVLSTVKISIYDTENYYTERSSQPLAEISGIFTTLPVEVVSRTKSLMVIFILIPRQPGATLPPSQLFNIVFYRTESPCKCFMKSLTINSRVATSVVSPGFPSEYCDSLNCPLEVQVEYGPITEGKHSAIRIEIHTFSMEHGADFLHLLDRLQHSSRYLISRTGELEVARSKYFTFNGELAELRMVTDSTVVNRGFNISIIAIERDNDCKCKGDAQPLEYTANSGEFSLTAPSSCLFLDCFFHISRPTAASSTDRLRLLTNITYEFKGAQEEFLEILRGIGNNIIPSHTTDLDVIIYEPGLSKKGNDEMTADAPTRFWYHLAANAPGGVANIKFAYEWRPICECGELNLQASDNEWKRLTSPDYPAFYCNSMKCQYLITAPHDQVVVVNITEVALEPNEDILALFNGPNITDKRLELATGIQMFNYLIKGSVNEMTVYFESDVSISNKGFVLFYASEENSSADGATTRAIVGTSGHLLLYVTLVLLLVLCSGVLFIAYQRNLFCFASRYNWQDSVVGFSNLTHTANTSSDERSLFP
uniref:CUB domain-containing protein n=1 Tax=Parascaris univalens TaxID=6257 RepID=A0A915BXF6_PARUN